MKIRTSYFYQIRNFKRNMIPVSTALSDPAWFHNNLGESHIYKDKRGILNGLRLKRIIVQGKCGGVCPCEAKDPDNCAFLKSYLEELNKINDFEHMYKALESLADWYQKKENIDEEIIIVLIVYEALDNKCSERQGLIDYFNSKGIDCHELDYPIGLNIKHEEFSF